MIRFDDQVAVVTGSGRGLGAAYARLLAARGATVIVHDAGVSADGTGFDPSVANAVVAAITSDGGSAVACHENLDSEDACRQVIQAALDAFGRLDILINNAGFVVFAPIEETDARLLERVLTVQAKAPFWLTQAALPHMKRQHYGRILYTTSGRATQPEDALPELAAYAMAKMAQVGLMHTVAVAGALFGIRANAISPVAATRMLQRAAGPSELRPEQVAPGAVYLVSRECDASGIILAAADGRFATKHWSPSAGVDFGATPATPEEIAARWAQIAGAHAGVAAGNHGNDDVGIGSGTDEGEGSR